MDILTLKTVIEVLEDKWRVAQDRYNLYPSDAQYSGKVMGTYEALITIESMLQEELDHRSTQSE